MFPDRRFPLPLSSQPSFPVQSFAIPPPPPPPAPRIFFNTTCSAGSLEDIIPCPFLDTLSSSLFLRLFRCSSCDRSINCLSPSPLCKVSFIFFSFLVFRSFVRDEIRSRSLAFFFPHFSFFSFRSHRFFHYPFLIFHLDAHIPVPPPPAFFNPPSTEKALNRPRSFPSL